MIDFYEPESVEDFGHYPELRRDAYATYVIKDGKSRLAVGPCFGYDSVREYLAAGGDINRCKPYTIWAEGALRFLYGWDSTKRYRILPDHVFINYEGEYEVGHAYTGCTGREGLPLHEGHE